MSEIDFTICDKCSIEIEMDEANNGDEFDYGTLCNDCYGELATTELNQGTPRDEAIRFARELLKQNFIVIDTETTGSIRWPKL